MINMSTERQIKYTYLYESYNGNMLYLEHYQQPHHLCEGVEIALQKMTMVKWLRRSRKYVSTSLIVSVLYVELRRLSSMLLQRKGYIDRVVVDDRDVLLSSSTLLLGEFRPRPSITRK